MYIRRGVKTEKRSVHKVRNISMLTTRRQLKASVKPVPIFRPYKPLRHEPETISHLVLLWRKN